MSVPSRCSEEWAIIGMPTVRCISEQSWGITCTKTVLRLSYKWNQYYFQLLWIGLLVTIPSFALQFRRILKSRAMQGSRRMSQSHVFTCWTFKVNFRRWTVATDWFVELAHRACVTDAHNLDVNHSAVIQGQYRTFDVIKSIAIECVLAKQGLRRSKYSSRRHNGFTEQKKHRAATVRLRAQIGWRSQV